MRKLRKTSKSEPKKEVVELTEVEWEIMKVLWEKEPCSAGTVQEELS
jgi:predicted transcriptional regulator